MTSRLLSPGIAAALGAAMLFGASTPIARPGLPWPSMRRPKCRLEPMRVASIAKRT
jgi:hypothetical protein